ncbi:tyrosine--tRNA ligase [Candidatus Saccharibacteria bacterium]|nr:tyrosine--tRNA ligase [Candidatus Saccharibacteria bacterium]MBH1972587.1 tyrosine--tRNA ligase [Candidatus Saccharibacteria bacterium]MBH1990789.1 tyrosine--tRNA ligase [Candidatus Saccharibacteria bacterium]OGL23485.1 MAG: tyrosine--tRNA ligase [Candidatus Saccharibacteria bacterium RIFCSPHIGHO2_01_FULL_46_30]
MTLSEELKWRGFVNQTTYDDLSAIDGDAVSFYFGVDPSADSMQIGNLAAAMMVRHFIDHGHKAYLLVGGATGVIGDPDGKKDERNSKTLDEITKNKNAIAAQYQRVFNEKDFTLVDNYDWFKDINYLDFLRTVGKHVPLSQMLGRDFVQARLGEGGSGISYAEFSYSLIQGYDFVHLYKEYGVTLQLCGADQWGNSIAGVDMIRRIEGGEAHVYSMPLVINKTTGVKFGKSEGGAVWLDPKKTSVYQFYQFWLNVDDAGVIDYAKLYTLLDKEALEELERAHAIDLGQRLAQRTLAREVTTLVHGEARANEVIRVTEVLFGKADFSSLTSDDLTVLAQEIPSVEVGVWVIDALVDKKVASSKGEARRLIGNGAISVNGLKIAEDQQINAPSLIKKGKNSFIVAK